MVRLGGAALAVGVLFGLVAACGSDGPASSREMSSSDGGTTGAGGVAPPAPAHGDSGDASGGPVQQEDRSVSQPGVDRRLIRTAAMELAVNDVVGAMRQAREIVADAGGYAGQQDQRGDTATVTLHVPSDRFDRAVDELSALGRPTALSQTAQDVTEQIVDVESRITTQRASVDRVRALLARAGSVNEIMQIENEVTKRESELESLLKRREALAGQVAMSKVTVRMTKVANPATPGEGDEPDGFLGGLASGWHAFLAAGTVLLRVVGASLPFLIFLGVPAVVALWWWRLRRRGVAPVIGEQQAQ